MRHVEVLFWNKPGGMRTLKAGNGSPSVIQRRGRERKADSPVHHKGRHWGGGQGCGAALRSSHLVDWEMN